MIPILPSKSTEDDRPSGLKFTRTNFFNFTKREMGDKNLPPIMSVKKNPVDTLPSPSSTNASPTQYQPLSNFSPAITPISSPTLPARSPFRIRDSQLSNTKSHVNKTNSIIEDNNDLSSSSSSSVATIEDDLAHELENIWKLKSNQSTELTKETVDINSEEMLLQLLISHAVIEAKEYKILSFEEYETLKQHITRLKNKIKNAEAKLEVDRKIQETSHSLSNLSTNKNRESVLVLLDEAVEADRKVKILTQRLQELKQDQVETQYQILKHTAGVLCLGLQRLELDHQTPALQPLQSELDTIQQALETVLKRVDLDYQPGQARSASDLLDQLEAQLDRLKSDRNHLESRLTAAQERHKIESLSEKKMAIQLKATQDRKEAVEAKLRRLEEKDRRLAELESARPQEYAEIERLKQTVADLESAADRVQAQVGSFQAKEDQLRAEMEGYRDEVARLRFEKEKVERSLKRKTVMQVLNNEMPAPGELEARFEQQLEEQEQEYQAQLKEQAAFLDKTSRQYDSLRRDHEKLTATCQDLELLIRDKQKALDARNLQLGKLESELQQQRRAGPRSESPQPEALQKLQALFSEKEAAWIEQSAAMEANFEGILKEFDRLTGTAMEFETDKMNYERRIEMLTQEVRQLEANLNEEKSKVLSQAHDTPTTASLRKEFRKMITDMKADHQRALEREIEERKKLEKQLKDLKHEREMSRYERTNKGVQTLYVPF